MIKNFKRDVAKILVFVFVVTSLIGSLSVQSFGGEEYRSDLEYSRNAGSWLYGTSDSSNVDTWLYRIPDYKLEKGSLIFKYRVVDGSSKGIFLTGLKGTPSEITIPKEIDVDIYKNGKKVKTIKELPKGVIENIFIKNSDLKKITFEKTNFIGSNSFSKCLSLESVVFEDGNCSIEKGAFLNCPKLVITAEENSPVIEYALENNIPYKYLTDDGTDNSDSETTTTEKTTAETTTETTTEADTEVNTDAPQYIYNDYDKAPDLPVDMLDGIKNTEDAFKAMNAAMEAVKDYNPTASDYIVLFSEEALARAATVKANGNSITIDDSCVEDAVKVWNDVDKEALDKLGELCRPARKNVRIVSTSTNPIKVDKKKLSSDIDSVTVVTPYGSVQLDAKDTKDITIEKGDNDKIKVTFNKKSGSSKVKVSFPNLTSDGYKAVMNEDGDVMGGKFNPITGEMAAKIDVSGIYNVANNEKSFSDIKGKSAEMQEAIKLLASKGIISGTSEQEFSPDDSITRAEVAAIILRTLSRLDANAAGGFADVSKEDWYYGVAGSSKKAGIITGYEDNTFRGKTVIPKVQIVSVSARVLKNEMNYKDVENAEAVLASKYSDSVFIAQWSKSDVALATNANMVIQRKDGQFGGDTEMTRGDAAIILKRLFDKIW